MVMGTNHLSITTSILAGIQLENPLMNGAYIGSKTLEDVEELARSAAGAVVVGSISVKPRLANAGQGYWLHKEGLFSLNSFGMPNGGLPYFEKSLPKMVEVAHAANKPLIANVIGFSNEEFVALIKLAEKSGADMVELNFGCPNVWDGGKQKRILSYHADLVKSTLEQVAKHRPKVKMCVKISPLPPDILVAVAMEIINSGTVQAITCTNSYPNAAVTMGARLNGLADNTLAGMSGRALKPISLGLVKQLKAILPADLAIIGCGGISTSNDVMDYLDAGAAAIQVATALKEEGTGIFTQLLASK